MTTRRSKGSGTVQSYGDGRYRFFFALCADDLEGLGIADRGAGKQHPDKGRKLSRTFTAGNQTEAERATAKLRLELLAEYKARKLASGDAERAERQTWTVERYVRYYMSEYAPLHLANTTRARYAAVFKNNVCPYIGRMRMAEVTPSDLAKMYADLSSPKSRKRGGDGALSGSTVATVHNIVRSLFSYACDLQADFSPNPATSKLARPNVNRTPPRKQGLTVAEVEAFVKLAAEKAPHIAVPVMLSARLGTRRGETVGLRWEDCDWATGTITVRRSVSYTVADKATVKSTKTGRERTIPLVFVHRKVDHFDH